MKYYLLIFFSLLIGTGLNAQYNKEKLRKESLALRQEIARLNRSLNQTKSGAKKSLLYLKQIDNKIKAQNQLLRNTAKETQALKDEIYISQLKENKLNRELMKLQGEYKEVLVNAYKNKSLQNKILFILSSSSFTEAFRRIKYLEKYSSYQDEKATEIKIKKKAIRENINLREKAKKDKEIVLAQREVLKENLEKQKEEQNKVLEDFKANEQQIYSKIKDKEEENRKLQNKIEQIIQEEIRIAKAKAEAERKRREEEARKERERLAKIEAERKAKEAAARAAAEKAAAERMAAEKEMARKENAKKEVAEPAPKPEHTPKPTPPKPTPAPTEAELLANNFTANQGRLPWPVASGEIIGRFGRQPHPVLKNIYENNAGIKIATPRGTHARAVYEGIVQEIILVQGGNKAVMISHGTYFTVYNNLSQVSVSKGQKVSTKQNIGTIYTDSDNNTILDFQVWKGTVKQNPSSWISGM